jgi:hypothetical protein
LQDDIAQKKEDIALKRQYLYQNDRLDSSETCNKACYELEKIRKNLIKKAAEVFEYNLYFPDYCISDMFKLEKCMSYSQIIQDQKENVSIDKPNFIICLKSNIKLDMIVPYQSDEHNHAVNYSISQIAFFIITAAFILNFELPFPLKYNFTHFIIKDLSDNSLSLNILEPYECENALIYLYQNLRILQQHAGADFSRVNGIFDIQAFVSSPFLGRYFDIPSVPLPYKKNKQKKVEENDDWELIEDSD